MLILCFLHYAKHNLILNQTTPKDVDLCLGALLAHEKYANEVKS